MIYFDAEIDYIEIITVLVLVSVTVQYCRVIL